MRTRSVAVTHTGLVREHNEDSHLVDDERQIYAVADGLGGHAAGEVASRKAIDTLAMSSGNRVVNLQMVHRVVHERLLESMEVHPERHGMGTTLTVAVVNGSALHVAHAGDSAAYLLRGGVTKRLTADQSNGHRVLNCLGSSPSAFSGAEIFSIEIYRGDEIVICSDGLTNYLEDDQHLSRLRRGAKFAGFSQVLVDHALRHGGLDNVTVVAVQVIA